MKLSQRFRCAKSALTIKISKCSIILNPLISNWKRLHQRTAIVITLQCLVVKYCSQQTKEITRPRQRQNYRQVSSRSGLAVSRKLLLRPMRSIDQDNKTRCYRDYRRKMLPATILLKIDLLRTSKQLRTKPLKILKRHRKSSSRHRHNSLSRIRTAVQDLSSKMQAVRSSLISR